jgi:hypothetical protein
VKRLLYIALTATLGIGAGTLGLGAQALQPIGNLEGRETRAANSYAIETSYDSQVCPQVLQQLNRTYWMPRNLRMPHDYAELQSNYFLGTHENARWTRVPMQFANGPIEERETANLDIFNSGVAQTIVRNLNSLASINHQALYVATLEGNRWATTKINFDPAWERYGRVGQGLTRRFAFPVIDVLSSGGSLYVLLKPLESPSVSPTIERRVYVTRVYGFEEYELVCTLIMR